MNFSQRRCLPYVFALAFCGLFAVVFVAGLRGQSYTTFRAELESIKYRSRWNVGPFWIDPTLRFNLAYDSSIYGTYAGRAPVPDTIATIAAPINIYLPLRDRLILTFTDTPQYQYFVAQNNESSFNNSYSVAARLLMFHRLVLSGSHAYNRAKYRVYEEIDRRIFEQIEANSGSLFFETPRGSAAGFVVSSNQYKYQDEVLPGSTTTVSTDLNRTEQNARLEFYRPAFVDSSYFLNFGYTDYTFEYPESRHRDSYSYQAYAGIRFPVLGRSRGLLSLGYKDFEPREAGRPSFSGLVGNTSLDFRFSRFGLRALLLRDITFSYYTDSIFYIDGRLGAGLSFYLSRNIRLDYDFATGRGDYPDIITVVTLPDGTTKEIKRKDNYLSHSGSVVIRIQRNTGIGFRINYWQRESNDIRYNSDRWTGGVYIIYDF
jgi:Putative beta-barrel porin 2